MVLSRSKLWFFIASHGSRHLPTNIWKISFIIVDGCQVYFSDQPVLPSRIRDLVASTRIGVALYSHKAMYLNAFSVGLSSGKIAHYLQCGLPVIVSNLPTLKRLIDTYNCGICVEKVEEVPVAVETIRSDYERYSENAIFCFQKEFDFYLQRMYLVKKYFNSPSPIYHGSREV